MNLFGVRLKEERERLNLSQSKFAEACNVGKTAQYNYEAGERFPDVKYLECASKLGVSVEYIVTGQNALAWRIGLKRIWHFLAHYINIDYITMSGIVSLLAEDEQNRKNVNWNDRNIEDEQLKLLVDALINDADLIDQIMFSVGGAALKAGARLPPDKFVRLSLRLLQQFKELGKFDQAKVEDVVSIAIL